MRLGTTKKTQRYGLEFPHRLGPTHLDVTPLLIAAVVIGLWMLLR